MKKFLALVASLGVLVTPVGAFFNENVDALVATASSDTVSNVLATAGNENIILMWDPKVNDKEEEAVKYRIDYGTKSVAKGLAPKYEFSRETPDSLPGDKISDLKNGTEYFLTVTAIFEDKTESAPSAEISATPASDLTKSILSAPVVSSAKANEGTVVEITFSEEVKLPENPESAFFITNEKTNETIAISGAALTEESKKVIVELEKGLVKGDNYRITASAKITDIEGNPIESGSTDSATFVGTDEVSHSAANDFVAEEENTAKEPTTDATAEVPSSETTEKDTTPPEDVTNFVSSFKARLTDFLVTLNWTASLNTAGDIDYQVLYRSENNGQKWDNGRVVSAEKTSTTNPEKPETEITYKLTVKDKAGNESVGAIRSVSLPALPATGSGIALIGGIALLGAATRKFFKK